MWIDRYIYNNLLFNTARIIDVWEKQNFLRYQDILNCVGKMLTSSSNWIDSLNITIIIIMTTKRILIKIILLCGEGLFMHLRIIEKYN